MDAVMAILSECAVKAGLCNAAAFSSVRQFILELSRVHDSLSAYFSKVRVAPLPASHQRRDDNEEHCDSLTLPHTQERRRRCPASPTECDGRSFSNKVPTLRSELFVESCAPCSLLPIFMASDIF